MQGCNHQHHSRSAALFIDKWGCKPVGYAGLWFPQWASDQRFEVTVKDPTLDCLGDENGLLHVVALLQVGSYAKLPELDGV